MPDSQAIVAKIRGVGYPPKSKLGLIAGNARPSRHVTERGCRRRHKPRPERSSMQENQNGGQQFMQTQLGPIWAGLCRCLNAGSVAKDEKIEEARGPRRFSGFVPKQGSDLFAP